MVHYPQLAPLSQAEHRTIDTKVNKFLLYKDPLNKVNNVDNHGVYLSERLNRNSSTQRVNKQRFLGSKLEDLNIDIPNSEMIHDQSKVTLDKFKKRIQE